MSGFTFKQFHVNHDRCAMKVGTDGVLLGAWVNVDRAQRILDLGTGSGLIALMLAQRNVEAEISAVELNKAATMQAQENFRCSPWATRFKLYQQDIATFSQQCETRFDVIVANPPYFAPAIPCSSPARDSARYIQDSHLSWLTIAESLLAPSGRIYFILPVEVGNQLQKQTALYCFSQLDIRTKSHKAVQRMIVGFCREQKEKKIDELEIYNSENCYTPDFIALTQAFYLHF